MTKRNNGGAGLVRSVLSTLTGGGNAQNITGGHKLDILKSLSATDTTAFSPTNPGDMANFKSAEVVTKLPETITADEADTAEIVAAGQDHYAENAAKLLKAKGKQTLADAKVQEAYRGYQGQVATAEYRKVRANGRYVNQLQGLRGEYLKVGVVAHNADRKTENKIATLKARYLGQ